ncbi:ERCC4 domain-containing protein [Mycena floridula]|nr:ERCC4 domain-containing protein [Mycena floridula]
MPPRRQPECANPQWAAWVKELRDAEEKGPPASNLYTIYNKALKSILECQEHYTDVTEARKIKFIGTHIVQKLVEKEREERGGGKQPAAPVVPKPRGRSKKSAAAAEPGASRAPLAHQVVPQLPPPIPHPQVPQFWYLNEQGNPVKSKEDAHMQLVGGVEWMYHIQLGDLKDMLPLDESDPFPFSTRPLPAEQQPPWGAKRKSLGELMDDEKTKKAKALPTLDPSRQGAGSCARANAELPRLPLGRSKTVMNIPAKEKAPPLNRTKTLSNMDPPAVAGPSAPRRTESAPMLARGEPRARPRLSHAIQPPEIDIDLDDPYASTDRVEFPEFNAHVLQAGTYDIVLVLDNREVKNQGDRSGFVRMLQAKGVQNVIQEPLALGDVCWIARRKQPLGNEYDKVVLDAILERKRLDDLCSSIKDSRFHEQKFRLACSGLTRIFYVVEDYDVDRNRTDFAVQIDTALSSTQVVDGFMVKETKSVQDTVNYYAGLHEQILDAYTGDLFVLPSEIIRRHSYFKFQKTLRRNRPDRPYLTTWSKFQDLNTKSGFTTVRETWARMLLCIRGMSAEKVGLVVEKYPTFQSMYNAFREAEVDEENDRMQEQRDTLEGKKPKKSSIREARLLIAEVGGNAGRKIGPALSTAVYHQLMGRRYEDL